MYFYLYWDDSDENVEGTEKLVRAQYASLEDAKYQAIHDLTCMRCRRRDETGKLTNEFSGLEPLNPELPCRDCNGTGKNPSKKILRIEKSKKVLGGENRNALQKGEVVWTPEDME